ncbi:MAG: tRNA uridine-5-carboxymethylaminomethyl(34) synthesis GTPase MnmE [Defluviitaleaceae bacterium]|nr:tRNA uridine-5-carboxymethylaminomethyl(34) synthesis GTPase MnmE [Defluviitaleaceae bacterium]
MNLNQNDTIAAPITPLSGGAVSVIRISGSKSAEILRKIYKTSSKDAYLSHRVSYGNIIDDSGRILDEVLVSVFLAPKSYTMEDVVEISCHGGNLSGTVVIEQILKNGARLAEPGEFTKRAFVNGRIDLSQAEAVVDIINSSTELARGSALSRLSGQLSAKINEYQNDILRLLANIEASIDYPEHDMEQLNLAEIKYKCKDILEKIKKLVKSAEYGKILRDGVQTAIVGRPNVGKSSLLNALLGEERAIVTDIAGTTRDTVAEFININGIPFKINDTAGIRSTEDVVEKIGVERSKLLVEGADLVLLVLDSGEMLTQEDFELFELVKSKNVIVVLNKHDLPIKLNRAELSFNNASVISISAKDGAGVNNLTNQMHEMYNSVNQAAKEAVPVTIRHKTALINTEAAIENALNSISAGMTEDIVSIDLQQCLRYLGEITGETVDDDIINRIFSEFCLGK